MIQRTTSADPVLDRITQPIVERFHPRWIILFGSRARGDANEYSDYDVLVEVDEQVDERKCLGALHEAIGEVVPSVNFFVRSAGEFDARADDPGTVDYDAAREGILLYSASSDLALPRTSRATRIRDSRDRIPPPSLQRWLTSAAEDLLVIDISLSSRTPAWGATCFHAQQAAEKYMKAVIVSHWEKPIRTHELTLLAEQIRGLGLEFPGFAREFKLLHTHGLQARYPGGPPIPDESTGRRTVEAGRSIVEAAKRLLPAQ